MAEGGVVHLPPPRQMPSLHQPHTPIGREGLLAEVPGNK